MPSQLSITATWFDTCYPDYLQEGCNGDDLDGKKGTYNFVFGAERSGQTAEELCEAIVDEVYSDEDFPCGDYAHELLKEAVKGAVTERTIGRDWHLWPVDGNGVEITDTECKTCKGVGTWPEDVNGDQESCSECKGTGEVEIPEEQPSAWFRVTLTWEPLKISLRNTDDDDGSVMVDCEDGGAAGDDGYIEGSTWEDLEDGTAYTSLSDRPTLVAELEKEGYEVDTSEYSPPDEEDMRYWHAKYMKEESAKQYSGQLCRDAMAWVSLEDVRKCRRVSEQFYRLERAPTWVGKHNVVCHSSETKEQRIDAYVQACWDAGLPLDVERWLRDRQ